MLCKDDIQSLEGEQWQAIKGTDNKYCVSDKGRIKSLCGYEAKILKPEILNGYARVQLNIKGQKTKQFVHNIVAITFLHEQYGVGKQIHHKDGNRSNNCAENL